jgi:uncharacterized protein YkwD
MENVLIRKWRTIHDGMKQAGMYGLCVSMVFLSGCGNPLLCTTEKAWTEDTEEQVMSEQDTTEPEEPEEQVISEQDATEPEEQVISEQDTIEPEEQMVSRQDTTEPEEQMVSRQDAEATEETYQATGIDTSTDTEAVEAAKDTGVDVQEDVVEEIADGSCFVDVYAAQVFDMVNEAREAEGLAPLTMNAALTEAARIRAVEITQSFSHTRPDGSSCFSAYHATYSGAAENIAAGQWSAEWVMDSWMKSEEHRANIMDARYTQIAIACYYNPNCPYEYYWVQLLIG